MKNKKTVVVVIPVHNTTPSTYELISFQQCFKILANYDIVVVAPEKLDLTNYKRTIPNFEVHYIHPKWQSSLYQYNQLKLSLYFYTLFKEYEFLLTYELDCFIFKDEVIKWCQKEYDYIGAPWFEGYTAPGNVLIGVGNSGFSLRKISSVQKVISKVYLDDDAVPKKRNILYTAAKYLWLRTMNVVKGSNYSIQRLGLQAEDYFLCRVVPRTNPNFKIASIPEAMQFAFETKPELLFEMNNKQLPMGCHAWWRYNIHFWKPYIESFGYTLS